MSMIYIVEDDDNIRQLVSTALQAFGYEITAFENTTSCLDALQRNAPDLLLFDIMLPDIDGIEAVKRIRKNPALRAEEGT